MISFIMVALTGKSTLGANFSLISSAYFFFQAGATEAGWSKILQSGVAVFLLCVGIVVLWKAYQKQDEDQAKQNKAFIELSQEFAGLSQKVTTALENSTKALENSTQSNQNISHTMERIVMRLEKVEDKIDS